MTHWIRGMRSFNVYCWVCNGT